MRLKIMGLSGLLGGFDRSGAEQISDATEKDEQEIKSIMESK